VKRCCFIAMPLRPEFKEVSDAILPAFDEPQSFQSRRITSIALGDVIETIRNSIAAWNARLLSSPAKIRT
jgi:hypothetical protein